MDANTSTDDGPTLARPLARVDKGDAQGSGATLARPATPSTDAQDVAPLTLTEAARRVGVSAQALRERVRRGTLATSRAMRGGRAVVVVDLAALADAGYDVAGVAKVGDKALAKDAKGSDARVAKGDDDADERLERLQRERDELHEQVARLRAELAASEKLEQAAQRFADKTEARLDGARKELLSLARALGQAEGQRDRLQAQLEAPRPPPSFWSIFRRR